MNTPRIASSRRLASHASPLAAGFVLLVASPGAMAGAQTVTTWNPNAVGSWTTTNLWSDGVPRPGARAIILTGTSNIDIGDANTARCGSLTIGGGGAGGTCHLASGELKINGNLTLSAELNATGSFKLSGGKLTGGESLWEKIGSASNGTFEHDDGSHGTAQMPIYKVEIGVGKHSKGAYFMKQGELFATKVDVGLWNEDETAAFTMTDGAASVVTLRIGVGKKGDGEVKIEKGTLTATSLTEVGVAGVGKLTLAGTGVFDGRHVRVASEAAGFATLVLSGGTFKAKPPLGGGPALDVGWAGKGTLKVTGGDGHLVNGSATIATRPGSKGTADLDGGLLDITENLALSCPPEGNKPAGKARLTTRGGNDDVRLRVRKTLSLAENGDGVIELKNKTKIEVGNNLFPGNDEKKLKGDGKIVAYAPGNPLDGEPFVVGGPGLQIEPEGDATPHGELFFGGDAVLEGGTIAIDIDGTEPGVDLDQVRFAGPLTAHGTTIAVDFGPSIDLAALPEGTAFPIVAAASFDGWFECVLPPTGNPRTALALMEFAVLGDDGLESWQAIVVTSRN